MKFILVIMLVGTPSPRDVAGQIQKADLSQEECLRASSQVTNVLPGTILAYCIPQREK